MVVLITGINLGGYIIYKFFGEKAGILLGGVLGGLISSTATTVSYAKRAASAPGSSWHAAIIIIIASSIVFGRVLLEIAVVGPNFLATAALPLLILLVVLSVFAILLWFWDRQQKEEMPAQGNPTELKSALFFALLYGLVLLAVAAGKDHFGDRGLYLIAGISGLTDVDAITLSTAQLVQSGSLNADNGWRIIVIAVLANLIFKAGIVATLGHRQLLKKIALPFLVVFAAGVLLIIFWPA
jgi:uncharacterized membrane protein (DUF4010 family)